MIIKLESIGKKEMKQQVENLFNNNKETYL
jgi:hypothetical protein